MMVDTLPTVKATLADHHLTGADLCLEVTERAALHEKQDVLAMLTEIRRHGISVALDDFGTGYSTLTQLRWLPVDILKIDRQFTRHLDCNAGDAAIVESTILLARRFGLEVVAEGVESARIARQLLRMGCYRAEGHFIQRAESPDKLNSLVETGAVSARILYQIQDKGARRRR
jgi:EAL domain-containing protein (putative c-di-GMP-specific phosphodiesterase class I)